MEKVRVKTKLDKVDSDLWQYLFAVPNEIAESFIDGEDRRVICKISGIEPFHCALMHDGGGGFFILLNQQRRKALGLVLGEAFEVEIEKDHSEFGMPMSDELREVLTQYNDAMEYFKSLTSGKQRTLIYWVDNVKSSDIKVRRALVMADHLIQNNGALDFKKLNQQLKEANQAAKLKGI